jgi:hypothetical protein
MLNISQYFWGCKRYPKNIEIKIIVSLPALFMKFAPVRRPFFLFTAFQYLEIRIKVLKAKKARPHGGKTSRLPRSACFRKLFIY